MNEQHSTAKDFFIHLGALVTLYVSVISLLSLLFAIINQIFPDALSYYPSGESFTVRWTISALVILFPLYIYLARTISKDILVNPFKKDLAIRKWGKYLTLFLTGGIIVGDLITLINTFLGGEIGIRFILKVVAVLLIAGFVFYYYVKDTHKNTNLLIAIASFIVLASIVTGFFTVGSPAKQRAREFDNRRVADLQSIKYQIENFADKKNTLPTKLSDIAGMGYINTKDPETKAEYEYAVTGAGTYKLCAVFSTVSVEVYWPHAEGRVCFDQDTLLQ